MTFDSYSENDTKAFAQNLGCKAQPGEVYCLSGDLGSGKTVFAKGFAIGLGINDNITSPTFTIINHYYGRLQLYHFDLYRIKSVEEMYDLGFEEYFYGNGVCLIEWAEIMEQIIPDDSVWITIHKDTENSSHRIIEVLK